MLLAAGKGERLRPLTLHTPKPLLLAGGKPLIVHLIDALARAGLRDLVINHAWLGEQLPQRLGDGSGLGVHICWSPEETPLETAGGIRNALPLLTQDNNDWFAVVNGDIWTDFDFSQLKIPAAALAHLVLVENPEHHPCGDFTLDAQGRVRADGSTRLTFSGISLLNRRLFEELPQNSPRLADLLRQAMDKGQVSGQHHTGLWMDIGTPGRLARLDSWLNARREIS